jgi:hypothetical protein
VTEAYLGGLSPLLFGSGEANIQWFLDEFPLGYFPGFLHPFTILAG